MTTTTHERDQMTEPIPTTDTTQEQEAERRTRRRRVATIEVPDELHALSVLTGRDPEEMIRDLLAAQVSALRVRAKSILGEC